MAADVSVYTTDFCAYCVRAKHLFNKKNVAFKEINVGDRYDLRRWLVSASGQRTVPQIFINGQSVGGFMEIAALERSGELDRLLAEPARADLVALPT